MPLRFSRLSGSISTLAVFAVAYSLVFGSSGSADALRKFTLDRGTVRFAIPTGWQDAQGLFNAPLTLLGPERDGARPVVTVLPSGTTSGKADDVAAREDEAVYRKGRRDFLRKMGGELVDFIPFEAENWGDGVHAQSVGFRYRLGNAELVSRSYYVTCRNRFYMIKSLIRSEADGEFQPVARRIVRSFRCE